MPQPKQPASTRDLFSNGGEMGDLMRSLDWSKTPLGAVETWPQTLRMAVSILLASRFPMQILWGPEYVQFYNDAYRPILGAKHPRGLGQRGRECWQEVWDFAGPSLEQVRLTGEASWFDDQLLFIDRNGYVEECYFTFSYTPVRNEAGEVEGIFNAVNETTSRVLSERRQRTQGALAARGAEAKTVREAYAIAAETLASNPDDIPFALFYGLDASRTQATLIDAVALPTQTFLSPAVVHLPEDSDRVPWPLQTVVQTQQPQRVTELDDRFNPFRVGPESVPVSHGLVLPIAAPGQSHPVGLLVVGISPHRALDQDYYQFFEAIASHVASALTNARAYEEERKRAEVLAELDRAKTTFFSNISHEFRTPLTLMLGPIENMLVDPAVAASQQEQLSMVHRSGLRLLKLVNTLLDFSRIEAGRVQAFYEATDLAELTAAIASVFRSTIEQAGMRLIVNCPPLPEPIYVDREMWEKIVLNLLSNAFKFTLAGEITVTLRKQEHQVELTVQDTGLGIPEGELPHLFERFYRVKGAQGRSYEGSGIGLSLVKELVRLHGGHIQVRSQVNQGTCFTVSLPTGSDHLPGDRLGQAQVQPLESQQTLSFTPSGVTPAKQDASRWLPSVKRPQNDLLSASMQHSPLQSTATHNARVLLVDDNSDMRNYVEQLLSPHYQVMAVAEGRAALDWVNQNLPSLPDLVLSDVMMQGLDGFGLLRALRQNPATREIPVILLSARAGEEARVEGLEAGADDYLIKPFSARELLARVEATLKMARLRQEAAQQEQELRRTSESAHQQISQILESITDAFMALDNEWRFTYLNSQGERLLRRQQAEVLGKRVWDEFPDAVGSKFEQEYQRAIAEQVTVQFEALYEPFDIWFEVRAYPFKEGLAVYFHDITQRKQAEQERDRLLAREQAARTEAEAANRIKDEFLAVLSHELRSPLNPILGWAKLLQTRQLDEATTLRALETIERNANLQTQLIEDLLDVSRILQGKLSLNICSVDLIATVEAAIETVRLAAEAKNIHIVKQFEPELGTVSGDPNRLQQVVWNLLSNAVKFTPADGTVEIILSHNSRHAQIQVRDNGRGIVPEFLPHVFDYFRQADGTTTRQFGGLGLGLAIVRHLTELHGGTVVAHSLGENQGSTFTVRLPLLTATPDAEISLEAMSKNLELDHLRVLVVDDEVDMRDLVAVFLQSCGAKVFLATSALEALDCLAQQKIDVLISDIGMPVMDGYTLLQKLRQRPPTQGGNVFAIALTAYAGEWNQKRALEVGFQLHITKPVEPEQLVHAIASRLDAD